MSQLNVDTIKNAAGTHERFPCTAWVQFNGVGTVAIRDSGNVSSITDGGVGTYAVSFATALDNSDFSLIGTTHNLISDQSEVIARTTSTFNILTFAAVTGASADYQYVNVAIFGGLS